MGRSYLFAQYMQHFLMNLCCYLTYNCKRMIKKLSTLYFLLQNIDKNNIINEAHKKIMSTSIISADEYLTKYYAFKEQIQLPLKINLYFTFLEATLKDDSTQKNITNLQGFSPLLYGVFSQLSKQEKAYYLYCNIESIKRQYEKFETSNDVKLAKSDDGNNITASGQICDTVMGLAYWSKVKISFIYHTRQIKIETKTRNFIIDLRLYLIRKSKKYKNTFVLEAVSDIVPIMDKKISLFFKSAIYQQVYNQILKCIISYRNQQLYRIVMQQIPTAQNSNMAQVSYIGLNSKTLTFLDSKNVNQFLNYKDQVFKKLLKGNFNFENIYADQSCKIGVDRSKQHGHCIYKLQANFNCSVQALKKTFLQKYKSQNFKYIIQTQQLQKFSNKYSAIYQKMLFKSSSLSYNTVEQIIIEEINEKQATYQNQQLIFQKGVEGIRLNSLLEFLMIKVKGMGTTNKSKLVVVGSFKNLQAENNKKDNKEKASIEVQENQQIIIMYLLQFSEMIFRKEMQPQNVLKMLRELRSYDEILSKFENEFYTVEGNFTNDNNHGELVLDVDEIEENTECSIEPIKDIKVKKGVISLQQNLSNYVETTFQIEKESKENMKGLVENSSNFRQETCLTHKYQLEATPMIQGSEKRIQKKHFLFEEWSRKSKGGLICKDNTIINEQKKVANYVLSTLGKRIMEQKGLMNLSLPVSIFKPESHLHSVAKNLSFAPLILERAVTMDPVERMKMAILYSLAVTVSSISVSKPFNPILGQTLQVWIDGCPAYFQQISHHPPIVAYYMIGRGYKLHGCIGPKTTFGFNSIIGYAEQPNFIQFDDGTIIELSFGKMVISGILLGERTFNFSDKMYAIDAKNKLFCDLKLGGDKSSFFSKLTSAQDMVYGRILKVNDDFIQEFYNSSKAIYPSQAYIEKQLSSMDGIWNGAISFDNKKYLDFSETNGCEVQMQKYPLPSDSGYRKDIEYLKKGNINTSQAQKQKLQAIQRRDRDLRKQLSKEEQDL